MYHQPHWVATPKTQIHQALYFKVPLDPKGLPYYEGHLKSIMRTLEQSGRLLDSMLVINAEIHYPDHWNDEQCLACAFEEKLHHNLKQRLKKHAALIKIQGRITTPCLKSLRALHRDPVTQRLYTRWSFVLNGKQFTSLGHPALPNSHKLYRILVQTLAHTFEIETEQAAACLMLNSSHYIDCQDENNYQNPMETALYHCAYLAQVGGKFENEDRPMFLSF